MAQAWLIILIFTNIEIMGIGPEYKIKKGKERVKTQNYWGTVRLRKDSQIDEYYVDVLIGKKDKDAPHVHVGINLDQTLRFVEPRNELVKIRREVNSKFRGKLSDESVVYKKVPEGAELTFKIVIDDPIKTIEVILDEVMLNEKS